MCERNNRNVTPRTLRKYYYEIAFLFYFIFQRRSRDFDILRIFFFIGLKNQRSDKQEILMFLNSRSTGFAPSHTPFYKIEVLEISRTRNYC